MEWLDIDTAPFDQELELAVIDSDGAQSLVFPCRRTSDGWVDAMAGRWVQVHPTHWRRADVCVH